MKKPKEVRTTKESLHPLLRGCVWGGAQCSWAEGAGHRARGPRGRGTGPVGRGRMHGRVGSGDCAAHCPALQSRREAGMEMGRNPKGNKPKNMVYFKGINSVFLNFVEEEKSHDRKT